MAQFTVTVADDALVVGMRSREPGTEAVWVQQIVTSAFADYAEQAWIERQTDIADRYEAAAPTVRSRVDAILRGEAEAPQR